jgi:hypothetical protein
MSKSHATPLATIAADQLDAITGGLPHQIPRKNRNKAETDKKYKEEGDKNKRYFLGHRVA